MKILALETSTNACSVAFLDGKQQDFSCIERFEIAPRKHTQLILPMIDSVLDEAGCDIKQIDVLAFGRGPGAFTGVRIATGVIQAISFGADLSVAQISSLAAVAQGYYNSQGCYTAQGDIKHQAKKLLVANDARMNEIYFGAYELNNGFMSLTGTEQLLKPEQLDSFLQSQSIQPDENWYAIGNGWLEYAEKMAAVSTQCRQAVKTDVQQVDDFAYPHAKDVAYLAFNEVANQALVYAEQVSPVYLRDNVAKKPQHAEILIK